MERYGRIDILVNNAGQGYDARMERTDLNAFYYIFDLDVVGPLVAMQQLIPIMRKQGKGVIVNISSGTALMFLPYNAAYSSLKRALIAISLTAREELKKDNISVGVVYPYITATDFEQNTIKDLDQAEQFEADEAEQSEGDEFELPPADSAEFVAERIIDAITTEAAEVFAHDWMRR
jgi:short-subunit dehydrogenase